MIQLHTLTVTLSYSIIWMTLSSTTAGNQLHAKLPSWAISLSSQRLVHAMFYSEDTFFLHVVQYADYVENQQLVFSRFSIYCLSTSCQHGI